MAAETRKSRKSNFSQEEIDVLITTVMQNHNILYGETSKSFFHKEIRNQVWNIILEEVNKVSLERRTLNEVKNKWKKCQYNLRAADHAETVDNLDCDDLETKPIKMKSKKHRNRSRNVPNPAARGFPAGYEPAFKKSVILYAEQKSNSEARKRYGISEETIKRWRKLRREIMEMAQQCVRRSQRHTYTAPSSSISQVVSEPLLPKKEKDKSGEEKGVNEDSKNDLDSMPLQQRLSQNHNEPTPSTPTQEPVLQSQPISPTKLKVTRQGARPQQLPAKPPTPPPQNPEVCLRWNSHHTNMQSAFPTLLMKEQYVDATLVSEGKTLKCHRMILSSCSPYFEEVLYGISPFQHPVLFMKDIPFWILKSLCDFMYAGEVHIFQDKLQELLNVAESLKIKGLAGNPDTKEDLQPIIPEIKQEIDVAPPPKIPEKAVKEEKVEDPSPPSKPTKHETAKPSKKKEDKKSKHSNQASKEKDKDKVMEEVPSKIAPKVAPKVVLPKVAPKVVPKVVLPKIQPAPRTTIKNAMKNVLPKVPKLSTSKGAHASRKSDTARKSDKHKADAAAQKEKEKEKEKPPLKKDNINDPLDLLQPVYEEIAKEEPPPMVKSVSPAKLKERGNVPPRKGVSKKVKKRRYAEYAEEREESPPPMFSSRKGTRSRPHVKIPKIFHTHYEEMQKETTDVTIVREPHTDQSDPLIGLLEEVEEIKAEPLDVEENTIEIEENLDNYMQDQEMTSQEGEEIIGNYDSPIVNIKREVIKRNTPTFFKKILESQPVIMNVHTVTEGCQPGVRLLNIKEENLKIVDISKISTGQSRTEETIIGTASFDPMEKTSEIIISNVQSMAECEEDRIKETEVAGGIMSGKSGGRLQENGNGKTCGRLGENLQNNAGVVQDSAAILQETVSGDVHSHIPASGMKISEKTLNIGPNTATMETNQIALRIKVENIQSENSQDSEDIPQINEIRLESAVVSDIVESQIQGNAVGIGSLGSLEAKMNSFDLGSQEEGNAVTNNTLDSLEANISAVYIENQHLTGIKRGMPDGRSERIHEVQNEIEQNGSTQTVSHNAEQKQNMRIDSEEMMQVDAERENRLWPVTDPAEEQQRPAVESAENYHDNIERTFEESDVSAEREGVSGDAPYYNDEKMQRAVVDREAIVPGNTAQESIFEHSMVSYTAQVLQQPGNESGKIIDAIPGPATEAIGFNGGPTQRGAENEEKMSIGTASQEMLSIGNESQEKEPGEILQQSGNPNGKIIEDSRSHGLPGPGTEELGFNAEPIQRTMESDEMMSIGTASQETLSTSNESHEREPKGNEDLPSQQIVGETEQNDLKCRTTASLTLSRDTMQDAKELETVKNVEGINLTVQESTKYNEESHQGTSPHNLEINDKYQHASVIVSEERLCTYGGEVTENSVDNVPNTEIMPIGSESQNTEQSVNALLPAPEREVLKYCEDRGRNSEAETSELMFVDEESEGIRLAHNEQCVSDRVECTVQPGSENFQSQQDDVIRNDELTAENVKKVPKDTTDNIEAELEQCLASTSNIAPMKSNEEKLKIGTSRLCFDDDEDFTKDIEFDNFIGRNRPANYLQDEFDDDFEMEDVEESKNRDRLCENNEEKTVGEDREVYCDNKVLDGQKEAKSKIEGDVSDKGWVCPDTLDTSESRAAVSESVGDSLAIGAVSREQNISGNILEAKSLNENQNRIFLPRTESHHSTDQNVPQTTENELDDPTEDEQKLEDRLLADLDEDIEMKEPSTTEQSDDGGTEKTLEMIVNDLNESLGELRK